ncbi:MAG TPA: hypothetical protein VM925_15580, partial [Labilithrix sp.]|nr:hypothetical protein [Labilithrix sp.]
MSLGPAKKPSPVSLAALRKLEPRARRRLAIAGASLLVTVALFATCGGCGKRLPPGEDPTATSASGDAAVAAKRAARDLDAAALRDPRMWASANEGDVEDLAALAVHEGAIGLVEAASDPALRPTAIRAMGFARGWAQLPLLAKLAAGKDDDEATVALEATV